jgi:hypothetical protein
MLMQSIAPGAAHFACPILQSNNSDTEVLQSQQRSMGARTFLDQVKAILSFFEQIAIRQFDEIVIENQVK